MDWTLTNLEFTHLTLPRPGFFYSEARGYIVPPFENHVPLVLTAYCKVFLKACPKIDHRTDFGFHGNRLGVLKVTQKSFLQKPPTENTAQMA